MDSSEAVVELTPEAKAANLPFTSGEQPPAQPKQEFTRRQIGALRKRFLTVEYARVAKCGAPFNPNSIPRTHCDACWEVYFRSIDLVAIHDALQISVPAVVAQYGTVFVKQFRRFVTQSLAEGATDAEAGLHSEEARPS